MLVKEVMSSPAICINSKSTIDDATKLMEEKNLGFLPVTENDVLVGVITDRDILLRGKGKRPDTQINKIMTKNIMYCQEV